MIIEIHRHKNKNIGDHFCNPSRYFNLGDNVKTYDVLEENIPIEGNIVVVGGGGLIHEKFYKSLKIIGKKLPKKLITWGIGFNNDKGLNKEIIDYNFFNFVDLCSLRDFHKPQIEHEYVPCVSCMHHAFDKKYEVKNKVSCFFHYNRRSLKPNNMPFLDNRQKDIEKTIKFIGETETLLTDSYHGAYWGQLLGKNVQVVSWSVKFDYMKYKPIYVENWKNYQKTKDRIKTNFLIECRNLNKSFFEKFKKEIYETS